MLLQVVPTYYQVGYLSIGCAKIFPVSYKQEGPTIERRARAGGGGKARGRRHGRVPRSFSRGDQRSPSRVSGALRASRPSRARATTNGCATTRSITSISSAPSKCSRIPSRRRSAAALTAAMTRGDLSRKNHGILPELFRRACDVHAERIKPATYRDNAPLPSAACGTSKSRSCARRNNPYFAAAQQEGVKQRSMPPQGDGE